MITQKYDSQFTSFSAEGGQQELANATYQAVSNIAAVVVQQKTKQDELKMLKYATEADIELNKATTEWRNINAENPTDETKLKELDQKYDEIFAKYDDSFGITSRGKWRQIKDLYKQKYTGENTKWQMAQNLKNADKNLNEVAQLTIAQGYEIGVSGNANPLQVLEERSEMVRKGVEGLVPQDKVTETLNNLKSDFTRNYLLGVMERSPEEAYKLMESPDIKEALAIKGGEDMIKEMKKIVKVQQDNQQFKIDKDQLNNAFNFDKNQDNMTIGQKLTELEDGAKAGRYSQKWAESKMQSLISSGDAETRDDEYADFINTIYSLPAQFEVEGDSPKFLKNVAELKEQITASKNISRADKARLEKELLSAFKKPNAKAVEEIASEKVYANAKTFFERTLPIEKRNKAMAMYFRKTQGIELTPDQQKMKLNEVVSSINNNDRKKAMELLGYEKDIKQVAEEFGQDYNKLLKIAKRKGLTVEIIRERLEKAKK